MFTKINSGKIVEITNKKQWIDFKMEYTMKKRKNYILISGRPGSGKTELLIAYANQYPTTTLFYSEENDALTLQNRGLNTEVEVVNKKQFDLEDINKFDTICIDYIQVFEHDYIYNLMKELMQRNIRIIAVSQMSRHMNIEENIFETVTQTDS